MQKGTGQLSSSEKHAVGISLSLISVALISLLNIPSLVQVRSVSSLTEQ